MRKRRVTPIGAAFVALVLLVLLFVVRGALHRPPHVVLPQEGSRGDVRDASLDASAVGRAAPRGPRPPPARVGRAHPQPTAAGHRSYKGRQTGAGSRAAHCACL